MSAPALVVLNRQAGTGQTLRQWPRLEPLLRQTLGDLRLLTIRSVAGSAPGPGAALAISTQQLYAHGPLALTELTTCKRVVTGAGHLRL